MIADTTITSTRANPRSSPTAVIGRPVWCYQAERYVTLVLAAHVPVVALP